MHQTWQTWLVWNTQSVTLIVLYIFYVKLKITVTRQCVLWQWFLTSHRIYTEQCHKTMCLLHVNGFNTFSKMGPIFLRKSSKFWIFRTIQFFKFQHDVVQTLIKQCMERKCQIGKSIFAVNLPLKLFHATIALTLEGQYLPIHGLHAGEILTRFYGQICTKFWAFCQKPSFFKAILTKRWRHFARSFSGWNNCLMINY